MKYVAYVLLALALLATIGSGLLIATMPTARMTVRPIVPTGQIWTWKGQLGGEERWPIWQFGITNNGRAMGTWEAKVLYRGPHGFVLDFIPMQQWITGGRLRPGEGLVTNMPVPGETDFVWASYISYASTPGQVETALSPYRNRFPRLLSSLPNSGPNEHYDYWRNTTNFLPVSAPRGFGTNR
jgi:hypothetical protein